MHPLKDSVRVQGEDYQSQEGEFHDEIQFHEKIKSGRAEGGKEKLCALMNVD